MKNYLTTSLKSSATATLLLVFSLFVQVDLFAQPSAVPAASGTTFCSNLGDDLTLSGTSDQDPVLFHWTGPDGLDTTAQSFTIEINSVDQDGDYCLITENAFGEMSDEVCVTVTVTELFEMTCPEPVSIFPDLANADCEIAYSFGGFTIDQVNCVANSLDYCLGLYDDTGAQVGSTVTGTITNTATNMTYGTGALTASDLDFGQYEVRIDFKITGTTDIIEQCIVLVSAIESRNNLTCNDHVNFTLTNDCQGLVTPDMILEGQYCFDMFELELEHEETGTELTGTGEVMISLPGTYAVTVTGLSGLSCWGAILAEDKSIPQVDCQDDVTMYCSQTTFIPGASVCGYGKFTNAVTTVAAGGGTVDLSMISGSLSGTVKNAWMNFSAEIGDVSDLAFSLTSPDGTVVNLADFADATLVDNHCERPNLCIALGDDASYKDYADFFDADQCNTQVNAYIGNFNPLNAFSGFAGDAAPGVWELTVTNATEAISELSVELIVLTDEGNLVTTGDIMQNQGCSTSDITVEYEDEMLSDNCASGNWSEVERTWTATNFTNGQEASCSQTITFLPWSLEDIIWPQSRDGVKSEILDCSDLFDADWNLDPAVLDEEGNPAPSLTGAPTVPFGQMCGNFQVTYEDLVFDLCGEYSKKIVRKWAVFDWCESSFAEYDQIIKIEDASPIIMTCAPDSNNGIIVNDSEGNPIVDSNGNAILHWPGVTDGDQCAGTWEIEPPLVIQNACDAHTFDFTVEFLIADEDGEPPVGAEFVSFDPTTGTVVNGTLNPTSISNLPLGVTWLKYTVEDECGNTGECFTEVAIVDETRPTPVCIENTVVAIGDDGCAYLPAESIDNSSWDNCGVVGYQISHNQSGPYEDRLDFCCGCNLDDEEEVYLRVTDAAGNSNTCRVMVEIQNNSSPSVSGGPNTNITRSCTSGAFDLYSIAQAGMATFSFTANCPNDPQLDFTVEATYNGQPIQQGDIFEAGECGVGSATIKYEVFDGCTGNQVGSSVNQSLRFTNNFTGFNVTRWPVDYTLDNCVNGVEPENLPANAGADYILTSASGCGSDTAISYDDQVFPDVDDACFKILRTWTVIDWCIVNAPGNTVDMGRQSYTQLIKVNDSSAPVITNLRDVIGNGPTCQHLLTEDDLDYEISDNCTASEDVEVSYLINGTPAGSIFGRFYDNGDRVTIEVTDHCDNVNTFSFGIFTTDSEAPTPYCNAEVVTTPNASGVAEIWVSDFSQGAQDNCDPSVDDYFLNEIGQETQVLTFDCDDITNGVSELIPVTVYFEDDAGNVNTCEVRVFVQDNDDVCPDPVGSRIAGRIVTADDAMVQNVMVELMRGSTMANAMMTTNDGQYGFENVTHDNDYSIAPYKEDSYLNGVSTIDLVQIQRHILGLERFTSPYKVIAADSDNNGRINGVDLVELRKLILGITTELPFGQKAWRLPTEAQSFADPMSPFPYQETIDISNHNNEMVNQNFVAVKIGDVNGSALTVGRRNAQSLELLVQDAQLTQGETVSVPVYAKNVADLIGLQTTMSFNPTALEFAGIAEGGLDVTDGNLGLHSLAEGYITFSWNNIKAVDVEGDVALFELQFNVTESSNLSEQFFLSSALTSSEAYTSNMEPMNLRLTYAGSEVGDFVLYQNIPNPFSDNTEIRFSLPATSDVTFSVYNVNGSEILRRTSKFDGGNNSILLSSEELTSGGVLYYKLETAYGTASRKMIQIR